MKHTSELKTYKVYIKSKWTTANLTDELLAAAPELLGACKLALPFIHDNWDGTSKNSSGNKAIRKIEQAIAKAEGK